MDSFIYSALPYYLGAGLFVFFMVMLIITGSMFGRQKNTPASPNEYLPDRLVFYAVQFTKKLKVMALITFSGFLVILPTAIAYFIGREYLDEKAWIPAVTALAIGLAIMVLIGRMPFRFKESSLVIDERKATVKYTDADNDDKVFYISDYDHYRRGSRNIAPSLVFKGAEGEEILSLHFLCANDAVTVGKMVEFIKQNGRVPVVQQVASKQEAQQRIAEQYKPEKTHVQQSPAELVNDTRKYGKYLEEVYAGLPDDQKARYKELVKQGNKMAAIKECREYTGEGLRIAKDLIDRYF